MSTQGTSAATRETRRRSRVPENKGERGRRPSLGSSRAQSGRRPATRPPRRRVRCRERRAGPRGSAERQDEQTRPKTAGKRPNAMKASPTRSIRPEPGPRRRNSTPGGEKDGECGRRARLPACTAAVPPTTGKRLEGVPERVFAGCSSSDASMSGAYRDWIVGVKRCSSPGAPRSRRQAETERVQERERLLAMTMSSLVNDVKLA